MRGCFRIDRNVIRSLVYVMFHARMQFFSATPLQRDSGPTLTREVEIREKWEYKKTEERSENKREVGIRYE